MDYFSKLILMSKKRLLFYRLSDEERFIYLF